MFCAVLLFVPLMSGCSQQSLQAASVAQPAPTATVSVPGSPTAAGTAATATPAGPTATGVVTGTATVQGTPTVRPTPTGAPPEPLSVLDIFSYFPSKSTLVKQDAMQLDSGPDEALFTVSEKPQAITQEVSSNIGVLIYDTVYREWNIGWLSDPISGTASPLLGKEQSALGGLNGGDLLRTGDPILQTRTTTLDGRVHMNLWRWNRDKHSAEPLKMAATGGGGQRDAAFDADLDINMADLDNDGVYEVVADNVADAQVWKWDGSKYVAQGRR